MSTAIWGESETRSDENYPLSLLKNLLQQMMEHGEQDFASLKARLALKNFFVPGGISDHFKVLVQRKD